MLSRVDKIDKVLARRIGKRGEIEYLIRWRGGEDDQDTWEVPDNLTGAREAVAKFDQGHLQGMAATEEPCVFSKRGRKNSFKNCEALLTGVSPVVENGIDEMTPVSGTSPDGSEKSVSGRASKFKPAVKSSMDPVETIGSNMVKVKPGRPKKVCNTSVTAKQSRVSSDVQTDGDLVKATVGPGRPKGSGRKSSTVGQQLSSPGPKPDKDMIGLSKQVTGKAGPGRPKLSGKKSAGMGETSDSPGVKTIETTGLFKQETVKIGQVKGKGKKSLGESEHSGSPRVKKSNDLELSMQDTGKIVPSRLKSSGRKSLSDAKISGTPHTHSTDIVEATVKALSGKSKSSAKKVVGGKQNSFSPNSLSSPKEGGLKTAPGKPRSIGKKIRNSVGSASSMPSKNRTGSPGNRKSSISPKGDSVEHSPNSSGRVTRIRKPPVRLGDLIPPIFPGFAVAYPVKSVKSEPAPSTFVDAVLSPAENGVSSLTDVPMKGEPGTPEKNGSVQAHNELDNKSSEGKTELVKAGSKGTASRSRVFSSSAKKLKLHPTENSIDVCPTLKKGKLKPGPKTGQINAKSESFTAEKAKVLDKKKPTAKMSNGPGKLGASRKGSVPKVISTKAKIPNPKMKVAKKLKERAVAKTPASKRKYDPKSKQKLEKMPRDCKPAVGPPAPDAFPTPTTGSSPKPKLSPKTFNINKQCPSLMKLLKHEIKVCVPKFSPKKTATNKVAKVKKTVNSEHKTGKGTKRKAEPETSSDEDILYSLNENYVAPAKGSKKSRKKLVSDQAACKHGVCDSDDEVVFNVVSPTTKKMLLKDSIRPKSKVVKPGPGNSSNNTLSVAIPARKTALIYPESTPYKTPPSSPPQSAAPSPGSSTCQGDTATSHNSETYMNDLPSIPVIPVIPTSPSAASYKNFIENLPQKLQANRGLKRKHSNSDSEDEGEVVERRVSVRQSESAFKYKEIVVKKCQGYTQIWLFTSSKLKNALNPKVFHELGQALYNAKFDDSNLVMLTGSGSTFCSGIDLHYLLTEDRRTAAKAMADAAKEFVNTLISFPKPVVAAVNGPAIGFGVALLPLCDIIYASDKASFYCPYARLGQTPEGCASYTFPQVMGMAMAGEMLLGGRKLTAIEAYQMGLVSQVFWPTSMMQEVVPRVRNMATHSGKALEASKMLLRGHQRAKLQITSSSEWLLLQDRWASAECHRAIRAYLDDETDLLF